MEYSTASIKQLFGINLIKHALFLAVRCSQGNEDDFGALYSTVEIFFFLIIISIFTLLDRKSCSHSAHRGSEKASCRINILFRKFGANINLIYRFSRSGYGWKKIMHIKYSINLRHVTDPILSSVLAYLFMI